MILDFRVSILDSQKDGNYGCKLRSRCAVNRKSAIENLKLVVALCVFLILASSANSAEKAKWQAQWELVVEAARKEGQVSLYGGQEITHPDIVAVFNKE